MKLQQDLRVEQLSEYLKSAISRRYLSGGRKWYRPDNKRASRNHAYITSTGKSENKKCLVGPKFAFQLSMTAHNVAF